MYNLAPLKNSTDWPFGLILDLCFKIGLGKPGLGYVSWKVDEIIQLLKLVEDSSTVRNWKTGGGISDKYLDPIVDILTAHEQYQEEWALVIRHSATNLKPTKVIQTIRKKEFGVTRFNSKDFKDVIDRYNEKYPALSLHDIETSISFQQPRDNKAIKPTNENQKPNIKESSISSWLAGCSIIALISLSAWVFKPASYTIVGDSNLKLQSIDFKNLIFTNIQFCSEPNFNQNSNKCLNHSDSFKYGIDKINISFESNKLNQGSVVNLRWYRYGEKFTESFQRWTDAFATDSRYASTFIAPPIEKFSPKKISLSGVITFDFMLMKH